MTRAFIIRHLAHYEATKNEPRSPEEQKQRIANINYFFGYADGKGYKLSPALISALVALRG